MDLCCTEFWHCILNSSYRSMCNPGHSFMQIGLGTISCLMSGFYILVSFRRSLPFTASFCCELPISKSNLSQNPLCIPGPYIQQPLGHLPRMFSRCFKVVQKVFPFFLLLLSCLSCQSMSIGLPSHPVWDLSVMPTFSFVSVPERSGL